MSIDCRDRIKIEDLTWGQADVSYSNNKLTWERVRKTFGEPITWDKACLLYNVNTLTWSDFKLIAKAVEAIKRGKAPEYFQNLDKEEKKRLITIIATIKGNLELSQSHIYTQTKEVKENLEVKVEDVTLIAKEVLGVNLQVENIHV